MGGDPARQGNVPRKMLQEACKEIACIPAKRGHPGCIFCPWENKATNQQPKP